MSSDTSHCLIGGVLNIQYHYPNRGGGIGNVFSEVLEVLGIDQ